MNAKKITVALALLAALPLAAAADVSKEDVKKLARAGLSDEVILSFIRANGPAPKLSADDIVDLKQAGVSDRVLAVLAGTTPPAPAPRTPMADGSVYAPCATTYVVQEPVVYTSYYSTPWYYTCWGWPYYCGYPYWHYVYYGYPRCGYYPSYGTFTPRGYSGVYTGYRTSAPSPAHSTISSPSSSGYRSSAPRPPSPSRGYGSRTK
jgi:hypothetical protein